MRNQLARSFVLAAIAAGITLSAQEMTKDAKIEKMLVLTHADQMLDQMTGQMTSDAESLIPPGTTAERQAKAKEASDKSIGPAQIQHELGKDAAHVCQGIQRDLL